jgi:uncharacterized protein (TIGR03382 family)
MQRIHLLAVVPLLFGAAAYAADPAPAATSCNPQTFQSSCKDDVTLEGCQPTNNTGSAGNIVDIDCGHRFGTDQNAPATPEMKCQDLAACTGPRCPSPTFKDCVSTTAGGVCFGFLPGTFGAADSDFAISCGDGLACRFGLFDAPASAGPAAAGQKVLNEQCAPRAELDECTPDHLNLGCVGDVATSCLGVNTAAAKFAVMAPFAVVCASLGGSCTVGDVGTGSDAPFCPNLLEGAPCDDKFLVCGAGLECAASPDASDPSAGNGMTTCQKAQVSTPTPDQPGADAGVSTPARNDDETPDPDSASTSTPPKTGCSATTVDVHGVPASLAGVAFLGALVAFRRRRA